MKTASAPSRAPVALLALALWLSAGAPARGGELSPAAEAGRALYRGTAPLREPPRLHGVPLTNFGARACAACHGTRGEAVTEAGVTVPAIQWQRLMQASSDRPAYPDDAAVLRALREGRSAGGRALAAPMPHFALDEREAHTLLAYLRVLGTERDPVPGVTPERLVLGSVLPAGAAGQRIHGALVQGIARVNAGGGVFGRQLALEVATGPDAASAEQAAVALVRSGRVFALVASLLPMPGAALRQALAEQDVAMAATLGMPADDIADARLSWLLPSLARQVDALAAELRRVCPVAPGPDDAPINGIRWRGVVMERVADGAAVQWQAVASAADLRGAAHAPRDLPARTLAVLPAPLIDDLRGTLARPGATRPACLGTLAAVSGEAPSRAGLHELVALPMPAVPLSAGAGADSRAVLWPLLADSALAITVEALARAGRQLDTARFTAALGTLHRFEARPGLVVDYSERRRHGFDVAFVWKEGVDHEESRQSLAARR